MESGNVESVNGEDRNAEYKSMLSSMQYRCFVSVGTPTYPETWCTTIKPPCTELDNLDTDRYLGTSTKLTILHTMYGLKQ